MASEIRVDTVYNESGDSDSGLDMSTNDVVAVKIAGTEVAKITTSEVSFNENSADTDFRVESNGNINMLFVDAGSDLVTIGGLTGTAGNEDAGYSPLQIGNTASSSTILQMLSDDDDACTIHFGDAVSGNGRWAGYILYNHSDNSMAFGTNETEKIKIKSSNIELGAQTYQDGVNVAGDYAFKVHNDGNNSNRYALNISAGADDASGTNYAIGIKDGDGGDQGFVTFSGGTVTYGAFTAHHEISLPDADKANGYPYGTLLETTAVYYTQKNGSDTERGIRYVTQKSSSQYSRKVLGTYCGDMLAVADSSGTYANNLHQAAVLGDGHIICNNSGGNIKVGDGICASATAGIGQKADKLCMIVGIAQKDITFSGSETVLVPVQYGLQQFTPWTD